MRRSSVSVRLLRRLCACVRACVRACVCACERVLHHVLLHHVLQVDLTIDPAGWSVSTLSTSYCGNRVGIVDTMTVEKIYSRSYDWTSAEKGTAST